MHKIPVMEIFGPTIQGEGAVIGVKTMFVRTAGCDYQCAWCDSAFTWDGTAKEQIRQLTPAEIVDELLAIGGDRFAHVTISGGNPALIGQPMEELIALLQARQLRVGLETQGSRWQDWFTRLDQLTISPKPPSSGMQTDFTVLDEIVRRSNPARTSLKVVVFDDQDFAYAKAIHQRYPTVPFYVQAGNEQVDEPGDISPRLLAKLAWLFQKVIDDPEMNHVRVLPQLHALVWHNQRGK